MSDAHSTWNVPDDDEWMNRLRDKNPANTGFQTTYHEDGTFSTRSLPPIPSTPFTPEESRFGWGFASVVLGLAIMAIFGYQYFF